MIESTFLQCCARGRRAWRRSGVFAVVPIAMPDGAKQVNDRGAIYAWRVYIFAACLLVLMLGTSSWIWSGITVAPPGWRTFATIGILVACAAVGTYSVEWTIHNGTAVIRRKVLGLAVAVARASNLRIVRYVAVVRYDDALTRGGASLFSDRDAIVVVLEAPTSWIVLAVTRSASHEQRKGWKPIATHRNLHLPLKDGGTVLVTNAW